MKICKICNKPRTGFYKKGDLVCKMCYRQRALNNYYENQEERIEQARLYRKRVKYSKPQPKTDERFRKFKPFDQLIDYEFSENTVIVTDVICSNFGCGKTLSITEKLFGNRCIDHQLLKQKHGY